MRKGWHKFTFGLFLLLFVLIIYTIWDNNRVKVVNQDIVIDNLPDELEGFKVLQVTDLHEKKFGANQERLIELINSIDYDAIIFTGDMLISENSKNYEPFYTLLEGINNKEHALFVPGNTDPSSYEVFQENKLSKVEFMEGMEKRGVKLLESEYTVEKRDASLYFVDFELSILNQKKKVVIPEGANSKEWLLMKHRNQLLDDLSNLYRAIKPDDVLIALNHYPIVDSRIDQIRDDPNQVFREFDLILAGHYHGGQIRLPFVGALFVPEPYYKRSGLFPPQDRVKGLWEYKQTKQYVSTGLGSSQTISFLKFRLFNTPEINVLSLKRNR
ncbi:metallophosphoesterase [Metabacillus sediminilitoris]|uniref:Calcineurin-like phosphoesterase domain-containing protein n=1 Tax=Metabacillus sediminilitoris TaxID=2567941 RepID=A0A4V3WFJ6_9BACI|nr:metallophosphoesterase [Metabacillus sediminilitoris]QGQ47208.1 hypothetical protein GMB29_19315 [Metabacillus sediminilitoris]THF80552.1 hypothetical protein E6W99_09120 [Metabacillus sediminilitoris]